MPNEMFVEFMCRRMLPKRLTRDMPLGMTNEFVESIFIITEGRVAVAAKETDLLSDDGDIESKRYNEKISDQNFRADQPGAGKFIFISVWAIRRLTTCFVYRVPHAARFHHQPRCSARV